MLKRKSDRTAAIQKSLETRERFPLSFGILVALTLENPVPIASRWLVKYLLQTCVVLLGFGMNLVIVLQAGSRGALFAAASIGATF